MYTLHIELEGDSRLAQVKVSPRFLDRSSAWHLEIDGMEAHLRKDDSGTWMQRSKDDLSPEIVAKVGRAIENLLTRRRSTSM